PPQRKQVLLALLAGGAFVASARCSQKPRRTRRQRRYDTQSGERGKALQRKEVVASQIAQRAGDQRPRRLGQYLRRQRDAPDRAKRRSAEIIGPCDRQQGQQRAQGKTEGSGGEIPLPRRPDAEHQQNTQRQDATGGGKRITDRQPPRQRTAQHRR